ncbi:MarR family winged helix-turn-helix transcriptional regulator [Vagococcus silagei]|uniref:MarR family transcriptional regulator n=1 Tax=Vagococcus silagei TaxID=2508885 RepID=A0A4S3B5C6_9ENTE|nr:MarR family winged helix-turn-helix transcriptional regulator [Vagococcus silagei]THB60833.1 MarR family transcriptional regulator [Vagococcus silagei]
MKSLGREIKKLSNEHFRFTNRYLIHHFPDHCSPMQTFFIHHIGKQTEPIFQKDLENWFNIRRSSASENLSQMENIGLIERVANQKDMRLKEIILTAEGEEYFQKTKTAFGELNRQLAKNLSESEIEMFYSVTEKMIENMKEEETI